MTTDDEWRERAGKLEALVQALKAERDSQATLAAAYLRERDAAREQLALEREACARVADDLRAGLGAVSAPEWWSDGYERALRDFRDAIRARGGR